jgi:hypothetical protein
MVQNGESLTFKQPLRLATEAQVIYEVAGLSITPLS